MTHPTPEAIARIIDPSSWRVMDGYLAEMKRKYAGKDCGYDPDNFKDKASLAKAAEIQALVEDEIYQLRLAITGGEDAPGYVMSLPLQAILDVQEENLLAHRHDIDKGEEFLEFKEALSDLRSLRQEHRDLTGGGPGWNARWEAAWAKVDELFADEDEAAYMRQQEDAHG